jgi:hypothetical protein
VTPRRRRIVAGSRHDRGAVLAEFALILPVVMLVCFGMIEYGFAFRDSLTVSGSARAGARVGSNLATALDADFETLAAVKGGLHDLAEGSELVKVVVYRSVTADGRPPEVCLTAATLLSGGEQGVCNVYDPDDVDGLDPNWFGCGLTRRDRFWCPSSRNREQESADWLGVHVEIRRPYVTGIFSIADMTVTHRSVMRLEPGASF